MFDLRKMAVAREERPGYLAFVVRGEYHLPDVRTMVRDCLEACECAGATRALIDARTVVGDVPDEDRFELGVLFAELWGGKVKAGLLFRADDITKMFENAAVNRSARVLVHGDEKAMLEWLLAP
jgi:hypothetical protein